VLVRRIDTLGRREYEIMLAMRDPQRIADRAEPRARGIEDLLVTDPEVTLGAAACMREVAVDQNPEYRQLADRRSTIGQFCDTPYARVPVWEPTIHHLLETTGHTVIGG
jgi:hypothetical protein